MILDAQNRFSNAQALTATAASTDTVDLGVDRDLGAGEPMGVVIVFNVALGGTSPTFTAALQTDDSSSFGSPATLLTSRQLTAAPAGTMLVIPLPEINERHLRLNYTLGGTSPTATVSSFLLPLKMIPNWQAYADNFDVA